MLLRTRELTLRHRLRVLVMHSLFVAQPLLRHLIDLCRRHPFGRRIQLHLIHLPHCDHLSNHVLAHLQVWCNTNRALRDGIIRQLSLSPEGRGVLP